MPLYMDIHNYIPGLTKDAIRNAHAKDLETQGQYGVHYLSYWFNDQTGKVFCLVEAPDIESAERVHREAHGFVADHIYEVFDGS
jgi:hypothetical protein